MRLPLTFALRIKPGSAFGRSSSSSKKNQNLQTNQLIHNNNLLFSSSKNFTSSSPPPQNKYYLLSYTYNPENLVERRAPHRPAHLSLAKEYASAGKLLLGGAFANPIDSAALIFYGVEKDVAEFVKRDPYVQKGIVTSHSIREWTVLVGADLKK